MKLCHSCGEMRASHQFYSGNKSRCKTCIAERMKMLRRTDPSFPELMSGHK